MRHQAKEKYVVYGPQGGISISLLRPESCNGINDSFPLVILMHGFAAHKEMYPIPLISSELAKEGIASLCFDFDAHGNSEGIFSDMTISIELADAKAVFNYACGLPFVKDIAFLGYSQGGVVAGMLAGQLYTSERKPKCLALLAPASSIKDDIIKGHYLNSRFNPKDSPEFIEVLSHRIGKQFIDEVIKLPIFETSRLYSGDVCLIFADKDIIVPTYVINLYRQCYPQGQVHILFNESHQMNRDSQQLIDAVVPFFKNKLLK